MKFLVAPLRRTQWIRNAETGGELTLKRGSSRQKYRLRPLDTDEKLPVLKGYRDAFQSAVQRYFQMQAGSAV